MFDSIRHVTSRFSLRDLVRCSTPQNDYRYVLDSVQKTLNSPRFRAMLESGQLYGYYGHDLRAEHYRETGDLVLDPDTTPNVGEDAVIPASRMISMRIEGDEIEHTQAILNTSTGRLLDNMERGKIGGWSMASLGKETARGAEMLVMAGCDWVTRPNFIAEERRPTAALLESAGMRLPKGERQYLQHADLKGTRLMLEDSGHLWDIVPNVAPRIVPFNAPKVVPYFG